MDGSFVSLISGFVGALIGAFASVATVWIQSREQGKQARLALIKEIAIEDYRFSMALAEKNGATEIPPLTVYLQYHLELAKCLESGSIQPSDLEKISSNTSAVMNHLRNRAAAKASTGAR